MTVNGGGAASAFDPDDANPPDNAIEWAKT